jgi:Uma2 family endonuclease
MATATEITPELNDGDRMGADEFERRYRASPWIQKAELIEGVVHVAPAVTDDHGNSHASMTYWLVAYRMETPHTRVSTDGTIRLDDRNLPQPDLSLRVEPDRGGLSRNSPEGYIVGPPELVVEVSLSSSSRDLTEKREAYRRNGIPEYLVWLVEPRQVRWHILKAGQYELLEPGADGWLCSEVFPGLWLDTRALLADDLRGVATALQAGLASPEHAAFVERLSQAPRAVGGEGP